MGNILQTLKYLMGFFRLDVMEFTFVDNLMGRESLQHDLSQMKYAHLQNFKKVSTVAEVACGFLWQILL